MGQKGKGKVALCYGPAAGDCRIVDLQWFSEETGENPIQIPEPGRENAVAREGYDERQENKQ